MKNELEVLANHRRAPFVLFIDTVIVLFLLLSTASFIHAQSDSIENFHPIGDFVLDIDEKPTPSAEFYLAEHKPAVLILAAELPGAVVLLPGDQTVHVVPSADVNKKPDGFVDIGMDSATDQGNLQILAAWIRFSVEGQVLTLKERPWLLGEQEIPAMENHNPEYLWRSDRYTVGLHDHSVALLCVNGL
jgi:hypothetical protein